MRNQHGSRPQRIEIIHFRDRENPEDGFPGLAVSDSDYCSLVYLYRCIFFFTRTLFLNVPHIPIVTPCYAKEYLVTPLSCYRVITVYICYRQKLVKQIIRDESREMIRSSLSLSPSFFDPKNPEGRRERERSVSSNGLTFLVA